MSIFERKPALRWLTPLAVVLAVGATGGVVATTASADPPLPERSAKQLLVDLQEADVDAMSGTVVQDSDLGIPALPGMGGSSDARLSSLISGTHTLDVWYSGPDKARLRIQGSLDETDVIKNGSDLWTWSYKDKAATHRTIAKSASPDSDYKSRDDLPKTPQEAADAILEAIEPSTNVTTDGTATVAGRDAYELVLTPKDDGSLVTAVNVAVDAEEHIPLSVEVVAGDRTAFKVAYTNIDFARPDDRQFEFVAPAGTKVTEIAPRGDRDKAMTKKEAEAKRKAMAKELDSADAPKIVGKGWTTVVVAKVAEDGLSGAPEQLDRMLKALPKVSGSWGEGRLLSGTAFSAVVTDDGRVAVGSVKPDLLYDALDK